MATMSQRTLSELSHGGQEGSIVIQIVRMWDCVVYPSQEFMGIDFLAIDSEEFPMHGCIPLSIADDFRLKLTEGKVYRIVFFEIGPRYQINHLAVPFETVLYFHVSTRINEVTQGIERFPHLYFSFASYEQLMSRNQASYHLTDIIGVLQAFTDVRLLTLPNNKGTVFKRDLFLTLFGGQTVQVTLFDPKIDEFDFMSTIDLGYKPILAVAGLTLRDHQGLKHINSCSATKIYMNPSIREKTQLKIRFPYNGSPVRMLSVADIEPLSACPYYGAYNTKIASLLIMNPPAMKGLKFKVTAKIIKLQSKAGWYYHSGNCCSAGIESTQFGYECQVHGATIPQKK
ncbi:Nucleic acid-binding protein [Corchorus olitorius]|uniref:Nucleic acid-binding protein n=1 Tax=Corchorus olitorius TaxID=93759 RepID=A0A1R3G8V6_9ROSI|nr:Nucleic acid-binding protein [Corchorus olitorius]